MAGARSGSTAGAGAGTGALGQAAVAHLDGRAALQLEGEGEGGWERARGAGAAEYAPASARIGDRSGREGEAARSGRGKGPTGARAARGEGGGGRGGGEVASTRAHAQAAVSVGPSCPQRVSGLTSADVPPLGKTWRARATVGRCALCCAVEPAACALSRRGVVARAHRVCVPLVSLRQWCFRTSLLDGRPHEDEEQMLSASSGTQCAGGHSGGAAMRPHRQPRRVAGCSGAAATTARARWPAGSSQRASESSSVKRHSTVTLTLTTVKAFRSAQSHARMELTAFQRRHQLAGPACSYK